MATIAKIANGTLLQVGDGASPEVFTTVPECKAIAGPQISFDLLDATSHDSVGFFREFIPGLADGDQITSDLNFRPSNAVHIALRVDQYARTRRNVRLIFPDSTDNEVDCGAYIRTFSPSAGIGQILTANLAFKITGRPDWSTST